MSKLNPNGWLVLALALAACHPSDVFNNADLGATDGNGGAPLPVDANETEICQSIDAESKVGIQSMEVALGNSPAGKARGRHLTDLTKSGDYKHMGAEMLSGHCWTYGQLTNDPNDASSFFAAWRCPVRMVTDDPQQPGRTMVDAVDDESCEFSATMGTPPARPVLGRMMRLPAT